MDENATIGDINFIILPTENYYHALANPTF
jgi:hypothetical protein